MTESIKERQTQAERRRTTRGRILQTAFDCLYELGYARTTMAEVCRRAGVSRGTVLHHFPTTADLVTAAADYVLERRLAQFREAFTDSGADRAGSAVDLLWSMVRGPTFYAWLELLVAARTDAALRGRLRDIASRFSAAVDATFAELFPGVTASIPMARAAPSFAFAVLNGLAQDQILDNAEHTDEIVGVLKMMARALEAQHEAR